MIRHTRRLRRPRGRRRGRPLSGRLRRTPAPPRRPRPPRAQAEGFPLTIGQCRRDVMEAAPERIADLGMGRHRRGTGPRHVPVAIPSDEYVGRR